MLSVDLRTILYAGSPWGGLLHAGGRTLLEGAAVPETVLGICRNISSVAACLPTSPLQLLLHRSRSASSTTSNLLLVNPRCRIAALPRVAAVPHPQSRSAVCCALAMADQSRSEIIKCRPIGEGLNGFRDSFKSTYDCKGISSSFEALDQLGNEGEASESYYSVMLTSARRCPKCSA